MKLISVYSESHRIFKDKWFLPTLQDDYKLEMHHCDVNGPARYMEEDWVKTVIFKAETIINAIKKYWGNIFIYSDVDIQFFKETKQLLVQSIKDNDIVCQRDDPGGALCTGFWVAKATGGF